MQEVYIILCHDHDGRGGCDTWIKGVFDDFDEAVRWCDYYNEQGVASCEVQVWAVKNQLTT